MKLVTMTTASYTLVADDQPAFDAACALTRQVCKRANVKATVVVKTTTVTSTERVAGVVLTCDDAEYLAKLCADLQHIYQLIDVRTAPEEET